MKQVKGSMSPYRETIFKLVITLQIEVRECLLSFGAESFVFRFAIHNLKIKIHKL